MDDFDRGPGSAARPASPVVTLTVAEEGRDDRVLTVSAPVRLIVGRDPEAGVRLSDPYVGRRHVLLEISPPLCRMQDLGVRGGRSKNVPHVNGIPARQCELHHGDVLEVGYTRLRVTVELPLRRVVPCSACGRATVESSAPEAPLCSRCWAHSAAPDEPPARSVRGACSVCGVTLDAVRRDPGGAGAPFLCPACLPAADRPGGESAGPFELLRKLGEGGMGEVFLAYDRPAARLLAVKRIHEVRSEQAVRRFSREASLLARLRHPAIVRLLSAGRDRSGAPFLAMEYVSGGNLESHIARAGRPRPEQAVALVLALLDGLEYLHSQGVIHRDIKPENILLDPRPDGTAFPRLADFGVSRYYEQAGGTRLTRPGTRLGTLMFMPPEQVRDAARAGVWSDTYSAGVTLYYLLSGAYSFEFPPPDALRGPLRGNGGLDSADRAVRAILRLDRARHPFQIILGDEPVPLARRVPHLPPPLARVVDRAVEKDPSHRFQTAAGFRESLRNAAGACGWAV